MNILQTEHSKQHASVIDLHTMAEEYEYFKAHKQEICNELIRISQSEHTPPKGWWSDLVAIYDTFSYLKLTHLPYVIGLLKYNDIDIKVSDLLATPHITPKHLLLAHKEKFKIWKGNNNIEINAHNELVINKKNKKKSYIIGEYYYSTERADKVQLMLLGHIEINCAYHKKTVFDSENDMLS